MRIFPPQDIIIGTSTLRELIELIIVAKSIESEA